MESLENTWLPLVGFLSMGTLRHTVVSQEGFLSTVSLAGTYAPKGSLLTETLVNMQFLLEEFLSTETLVDSFPPGGISLNGNTGSDFDALILNKPISWDPPTGFKPPQLSGHAWGGGGLEEGA
jgi:hypothetical protein